VTGGYDEGYRAGGCFWGRGPASLFVTLSRIITDYRGLAALDVGCGEGKNTAYLLERGASVRSIDISPYALANACAAWPAIPREQWERGDVRCLTFPEESLDLVVAYGLLHCFRSQSEIAEVARGLQRATKRGGFHVVCAFNSRLQELEAHPGFQPCLLDHRAYLDFYRTWELVVESDADLVEVHPHNGIPHRHALTRIIARKAVSS
jgi:SAM-dependent methyltransferase